MVHPGLSGATRLACAASGYLCSSCRRALRASPSMSRRSCSAFQAGSAPHVVESSATARRGHTTPAALSPRRRRQQQAEVARATHHSHAEAQHVEFVACHTHRIQPACLDQTTRPAQCRRQRQKQPSQRVSTIQGVTIRATALLRQVVRARRGSGSASQARPVVGRCHAGRQLRIPLRVRRRLLGERAQPAMHPSSSACQETSLRMHRPACERDALLLVCLALHVAL